jgi:hypothetical protein
MHINEVCGLPSIVFLTVILKVRRLNLPVSLRTAGQGLFAARAAAVFEL